jgi:hypothetical protein
VLTKEEVAEFKDYFGGIRSFSESLLAEMAKRRSIKHDAKEAVTRVRKSGRRKN